MMKKQILLIISTFSFVCLIGTRKINAQVFWTEDFQNSCASGCFANSYVGSNGAWTVTSTGDNTPESNAWFISGSECGNSPMTCSTPCGISDASLHIGINNGSSVDLGATYDIGLGPDISTSVRVESPFINCSGRSSITVAFDYIEQGDVTWDDATFWYFDGTSWSNINSLPKTIAGNCGSQSLWTHYSFVLPFSANNNPNIKIGINWINDYNQVGDGISFAIDDISLTGYDQKIKTIAGNHSYGYNGDNKPAIDAQLNEPRGIVLDSVGNIYVADCSNHRIRKISPSGIITTFAGNGIGGSSGDGGPAISASLGYPYGMIFDAAGNMYIADCGNHKIRKVNTSGIISTVAGNGIQGYSGDGGNALSAKLYWPMDIALDFLGNIYIADYGNNVIRKINSSGVITTVVGTGMCGYSGDGGLADTAKICRPQGIAFDHSGNLFITDGGGNYKMRKVNTLGVITSVSRTVSSYPGYFNASKIVFDNIGNMYIAEDDVVTKIDTLGTITIVAGSSVYGYSGDGGLATNATMYGVSGVAIDAIGNVYIGDTQNHVVRKVGSCMSNIPSICMVEVDSLSEYNVIYWDKTQYPTADTFYFYRDTANYNYAPIGKLAASNLSVYSDTARALYTASGNPNVTSWRYKMAYGDTCGGGRVLSPMSPWHQTINQYNIGGLFIWNQYEIEGQPTPVPGLQNYLLKRDNNATGNYITAATASASSTNINDIQYTTFQSTADWRVETLWGISCTPTLRLNIGGKENEVETTVVRSKSNIKNNRTIGIKDGKNLETRLKVYPNPASGLLNVEVSLLNEKEATITIENMLGQVFYTMQTNKPINSINTVNFMDGVYFVKVEENSVIKSIKLIIQK